MENKARVCIHYFTRVPRGMAPSSRVVPAICWPASPMLMTGIIIHLLACAMSFRIVLWNFSDLFPPFLAGLPS